MFKVHEKKLFDIFLLDHLIKGEKLCLYETGQSKVVKLSCGQIYECMGVKPG
jgi:hypothetical protein